MESIRKGDLVVLMKDVEFGVSGHNEEQYRTIKKGTLVRLTTTVHNISRYIYFYPANSLIRVYWDRADIVKIPNKMRKLITKLGVNINGIQSSDEEQRI